MKKMFQEAVVVLALALIAEAKPMSENQKFLDEARQKTDLFETELEPERLREASQSLLNVMVVAEHDSKIRARIKSDCLFSWLRLIQLLDRFLDSNFNPQDVPSKLVQPPPAQGGVVYPPGADPALIEDPRLRAEYSKAIQANQEKINRYRLQTHLARLSGDLSQRADAFILNSYTSSREDQRELKTAIESFIHDPKRKAHLLTLIASHHP